MTLATIITDAAWSPRERYAGWAGEVITSEGRRTYSQPFKGPVFHSNIAELGAVLGTLHSALKDKQPVLYPGYDWLIQLDNLWALGVLKWVWGLDGKPPSMDGEVTRYLEMARQLKPFSRRIELRHIKAHSGTDTARTYVHDRIDKAAKAAKDRARELW